MGFVTIRSGPAPSLSPQAVANNALLDLIAVRAGVRFNVDLARLLHINTPTMSRIRNGRMDIGATLQLAMLDSALIDLATLRQYVPALKATP